MKARKIVPVPVAAPEDLDTATYLTRATNLARNTRGDFVSRHTPAEWLRIYDAYRRCGWDITPDQWTPEQVAGAIAGGTPRWHDDESPADVVFREPCAQLRPDAFDLAAASLVAALEALHLHDRIDGWNRQACTVRARTLFAEWASRAIEAAIAARPEEEARHG